MSGFTAFYTIVGFCPEPFTRVADGGYGYSAKPRTYSNPGQARNMRTRLQKRATSGVTYKILETVIHGNGVESTNWIE